MVQNECEVSMSISSTNVSTSNINESTYLSQSSNCNNSNETNKLPIIDNYSVSQSSRIRSRGIESIAMSPPSFMNSPMFPNESLSKFNIIDNYDTSISNSNSSVNNAFVKMQSMPILPFESSNDSKSLTESQKTKSSISDYIGTSLKMLRDSFHSQTLH